MVPNKNKVTWRWYQTKTKCQTCAIPWDTQYIHPHIFANGFQGWKAVWTLQPLPQPSMQTHNQWLILWGMQLDSKQLLYGSELLPRASLSNMYYVGLGHGYLMHYLREGMDN